MTENAQHFLKLKLPIRSRSYQAIGSCLPLGSLLVLSFAPCIKNTTGPHAFNVRYFSERSSTKRPAFRDITKDPWALLEVSDHSRQTHGGHR